MKPYARPSIIAFDLIMMWSLPLVFYTQYPL